MKNQHFFITQIRLPGTQRQHHSCAERTQQWRRPPAAHASPATSSTSRRSGVSSTAWLSWTRFVMTSSRRRRTSSARPTASFARCGAAAPTRPAIYGNQSTTPKLEHAVRALRLKIVEKHAGCLAVAEAARAAAGGPSSRPPPDAMAALMAVRRAEVAAHRAEAALKAAELQRDEARRAYEAAELEAAALTAAATAADFALPSADASTLRRSRGSRRRPSGASKSGSTSRAASRSGAPFQSAPRPTRPIRSVGRKVSHSTETSAQSRGSRCSAGRVSIACVYRHTPRWLRVLLVADAVMRLRRRLPSLAYRAGFGSLLMLQVSVATLMAAPHHCRRDPAPPPSSDKTAVSVWTQERLQVRV